MRPAWPLIVLLGLGLLHGPLRGEPIADVHLHYKWSQQEVTSVEQVLRILDENQVGLALVTGTPPELALTLAGADPERILPAYGIYQLSGSEKARWSWDPDLLVRARQALSSGRYRAIGEVHMIPGFMARPETPVVRGLLELAAEFDLPFWFHTEFSRPDFIIDLCRTHPKVRLLWAHAGSVLSSKQVDEAMAACPNLWMELAARDPWRHRSEIITDGTGALKPDWRALIVKYQDRVMVGSDPVWPVEQLEAWDQSDTGWQEVGRFLRYHRAWIDQLPQAAARKIRIDNALQFFHDNR